jgi:DNA-binding transcriptional LysR family regulator
MFIRDAALAGLGIALVPSFIVAEELRSGALKALHVGYEPEGADLNIAYPRDRTSSAKLLALTGHLRLAFGSPPYWDVARGHEPG